jgi:hypothetical protein
MVLMEKETWDLVKSKHIKTPKKMIDFFNDIEEVYKKHNLSISHEDGHGAFIIEEYDEFNIQWLKRAQKRF